MQKPTHSLIVTNASVGFPFVLYQQLGTLTPPLVGNYVLVYCISFAHTLHLLRNQRENVAQLACMCYCQSFSDLWQKPQVKIALKTCTRASISRQTFQAFSIVPLNLYLL